MGACPAGLCRSLGHPVFSTAGFHMATRSHLQPQVLHSVLFPWPALRAGPVSPANKPLLGAGEQ